MRNAEGFLCVFFFAPAERGARTASACSSLTGGEFFAEIQRGVRRRCGGSMPRPAAGQEGRHQGFYPLNSHFLLFLSLAQTGDRRPLRNGERQRIFSTVGEHSVLPCRNLYAVPDTLLLHMRFRLRRRDIPVSRNPLARCNGRHLRI